MKIALAQVNPRIGDFAANLAALEAAYGQAVAAGAGLVAAPELALCGYPPRDLLERAAFRAECRAAVDRAAAIAGEVPLVFGAPLETGGALPANAAVVARRGAVVATRAKRLLPSYDVFDETRYFAPGPADGPWEFGGERIGITVCEDAWVVPGLPEAARYGVDPVAELAARGASVLLNLSASPFQAGKQPVRHRIAAYHGDRHRLPFFLVNQAGGNDELLFDGASFARGTDGAFLRARSFAADLLVADAARVVPGGPPELDDVAALHAALVMGIRDYAAKCGFSTAVIGLSGGIDSAVTAALACAALGPANVSGLTMPSRYSSPGSVTDSRALAANFGMALAEVPIEGAFGALTAALGELFAGTASGLAEENLQARVRGTLLMASSNKFGQLLLSTGNKSELSMGYCTLYGDMNGGLAVLGDVLKTQVYALARWINRGRELIPASSIEKPPSAELRPDQKDEDSLPPYPVLDAVLAMLLEEGLPPEAIAARGYDEALVRGIARAVDRAEYKRRQAPPVLRVTGKAFGSGRRMPLAARYD